MAKQTRTDQKTSKAEIDWTHPRVKQMMDPLPPKARKAVREAFTQWAAKQAPERVRQICTD